MALLLTTGSFAGIEQEFCRDFQECVRNRKDPFLENHLTVVPSSALRKHLLCQLFETGCASFAGVRTVSLNGLAQEILLDSMVEPYTALDDPIFFALMVQEAVQKTRLKQFQGYRTAKGLLSTIRDMADGLLTPELLEQFLEQARTDTEIQERYGDPKTLSDLHEIYRLFMNALGDKSLINMQFASARASQTVKEWMQQKNICSAQIYGFYDATPAQFELIEAIVRHVHSIDGRALIYFPFSVTTNSVEPNAEYSQEFLDSLHSLMASQGGSISPLDTTAGIETRLFTGLSVEESDPDPVFEIFNCGSPQEEAWAVAKKILHLVLHEGVRFDQIGVVSRSLDPVKTVFQQVFEENQIPHTLNCDTPLSSWSSAHFVYLLLSARHSHLNHNVVFELLCSPLLKERFSPAGIVRDLLELLFVTNSDDWHRLNSLVDERTRLPEIFELNENDWRVQEYRRAALYLLDLKHKCEQIPAEGRISDFTDALQKLIEELAEASLFEEAGGTQLQLLLQRMSDLPLESEYTLTEFTEIFRDYLKADLISAPNHHPETNESNGDRKREKIDAEGAVTIGDIMSLRGTSFEILFLAGLNQDVFPIRATEDPFLSDSARRIIRSTTGAGPHPRRTYHPDPTSGKKGNDEELLLFTLAIRSARQRLYFSYQRADSDGRKKSPSIYIEEVLRLLTRKTSGQNLLVQHLPRHLGDRLDQRYLPAPQECAILVERYSPYEVLQRLYGLRTEYTRSVFSFSESLNSMDRNAATEIDGMLSDSKNLWKTFFDGKLRYSYSRIKDYVRCPFMFFSDRILKLESSPFQPTQVQHDLTPVVKGRLAESVVKEAINKIKSSGTPIDQAINHAENKVRRKYGPYLPKVLMDHYLIQFSRAALVLLEFLESEGYDFAYAEIPDRGYDAEMPLVASDQGKMNIYGIPDLLFYGSKRLIGEMKWGASATAETSDQMFKRGELQFCCYPELERQHRQLLEVAEFRYFRLNIFAEIGSPKDLERKLRSLGSPGRLDTTLRIFGHAPSTTEVSDNLERLKAIGEAILRGEFRIVEDPGDFFSPCTTCKFSLICRRTHSATLLRAKKENVYGGDSNLL